jgi:ADP-ribose pyrophosphatase YjhB (NUDIX family)
MNDKDPPLASDFQPLEGEATFGPPILREVVGGTHIAPECITVNKGAFIMTEWPLGLPRHDKARTVRFPHGLIRVGETIEDCARRLVANQQGMNVDSVTVLDIDSYVDDAKHWHIEPLLWVEVSGVPKLPKEASRIVSFRGHQLPEGAVWGQDSFDKAFSRFFEPLLKQS